MLESELVWIHCIRLSAVLRAYMYVHNVFLIILNPLHNDRVQRMPNVVKY